MHPSVDIRGDVVALTRALCDVESVSGNEGPLVDTLEDQLRTLPHLKTDRIGNTLIARTNRGRAQRVIVAGHVDTVPVGRKNDAGEPNFPTWTEIIDGREVLFGRGTCDMKGGVAVGLSCAVALENPKHDVTWIFYDNEEVESAKNGLLRVERELPEALQADFAILCEPTAAQVEGGCNGTLRIEMTIPGVPAHSARAWMGQNAIHAAAPVLQALAGHDAGSRIVDGLEYRQSLSAVLIRGGMATNVIPDECVVTINYRFAPDRTVEAALADLLTVLPDYPYELIDGAGGARPGLTSAIAREFVTAAQASVSAKVGWTDVSRFSAMGTPAVNFGPGDPLYAHRDDEHVVTDEIRRCRHVVLDWLS